MAIILERSGIPPFHDPQAEMIPTSPATMLLREEELPRRKCFNRAEYHQMDDLGMFTDGRGYELINGDVYEKYPPLPAEEPRRKPFTRVEFHQLAEQRVLGEGRRFELIAGDIIDKMGQKEPHISLVMRLLFALAAVFGDAFVRCQMPIVADDKSEPEPDISVTVLPREAYMASRMTTTASDVCLVVEVSVSTLMYDTANKALLYAQSAIPEFWALDVVGRRLIVHRNPAAEGYASVVSYGEDDSVSPLAAPQATFAVKDYLPQP